MLEYDMNLVQDADLRKKPAELRARVRLGNQAPESQVAFIHGFHVLGKQGSSNIVPPIKEPSIIAVYYTRKPQLDYQTCTIKSCRTGTSVPPAKVPTSSAAGPELLVPQRAHRELVMNIVLGL